MKTTIIIGADGQDGYYLGNLLERKAYDDIHIDKYNYDPQTKWQVDIDFNICDSLQVEALIKRIKPEEIYFLAAFHQSAQDNYIESIDVLKKSIDIHEIALFNILVSIFKYSLKTKLFYAASSHISGDPTTETQDENTSINPINLYGITKASGLFLCRKFRREHGVFSSCDILYNHESSRRSENFLSKKITIGIRDVLNNKSAIVEVGNLDSIADWGYAPDYVDAIFRILQLSEPEDFVFATGVKHTVQEFVSIAFTTAGLNWNNHIV